MAHGCDCVVCRIDAASALALFFALQSAWPVWPVLRTPVFGRPLRLAKLMFQRVISKMELCLGLSLLGEGNKRSHLLVRE